MICNDLKITPKKSYHKHVRTLLKYDWSIFSFCDHANRLSYDSANALETDLRVKRAYDPFPKAPRAGMGIFVQYSEFAAPQAIETIDFKLMSCATNFPPSENSGGLSQTY